MAATHDSSRSDTPASEPRTRLSWKARSLLVLASVTLTLGVLEIVFRAMEGPAIDAFFSPFEHSDESFAERETDASTARTLTWYIPHAEGMTGSVPVKINNLGLRDERDYPEKKTPGCLRVLALGDSMTFGKGVRETETFLAVVEDRLRAQYPKRCIEILNAGQPNTNFFQHYFQYTSRWYQFDPDVVLVCFFPYNDTQVEDDEEPFSQSWMEFVDRNAWLKSSAIVRWIYYRLFFNLGNSALADAMERFFADDYPGWEQFGYYVPKLAFFANEKRSEVAFVIVPVPAGYDEYPYTAQHRKVADLVGQNGIPTYDLLDSVRGRGINAADHWVHPSDAHPDAALHRMYGEWMVNALPWRMWMDRAR